MSKVLCIFHANCADGLGAAWAVHRALGDEVEFVTAKYGERVVGFRGSLPIAEGLPECIIGRDILIVDFSYPLPVLRAMAAEARSVLVLDHHKTAQEDLKTLHEPPSSWNLCQDYLRAKSMKKPTNLAAIFDLNRSGSGITWDYIHPNTPRPRIIDLIEDRDLWRFKYGDETRAFHAVLTSYDIADLPAMFEWLDEWAYFADFQAQLYQKKRMVEGGSRWEHLMKEGRAIRRANRQSVAATLAASRRTIKIAGHIVPCANVPPAMASDAGHLLCQHPPEAGVTAIAAPLGCTLPFFSATYYDGADGKRHFSLRSPEGGADVGEIAKRMAEKFNEQRISHLAMTDNLLAPFAGGGHEHAAGFDSPLGWEGE